MGRSFRENMSAGKQIPGERRRSRRFPIKCKVQWHIAGKEEGTGTVDGETINISGSGVLFTSNRSLKLGRLIELAISWPVLLNHECPLKLVARGRVVRNDEGCGAIQIEHHEFRTAAPLQIVEPAHRVAGLQPFIGSPTSCCMSDLPNQNILIGKETDSHISIRVTERLGEDRMKVEVTVSFPVVKGTCKSELENGELRRFASDVENVERTQTGVAQLTIIPGSLVFNVLFDEKRQLIFALRHRRNPALGVDTISTFPLNPAELPAVIDSLRAADPGE
jgi:hypothetical protein